MKYFILLLLFTFPAFAQECGNGEVEEGEACDDGNSIATDACVDCQPAICGDNIVWIGVEQCDDGNQENEDFCRNNCQDPFCGDSILDANEVCDDGNEVDWDGCKGDCSLIENNEDVLLYKELVSVEFQKASLLHNQQEFNQANKDTRKAQANAQIEKWELQKTKAVGRQALIDSIQNRIDKMSADRDWYDSNEEGSPSDIASKLGPQISELSQLIGQLKIQLGIQ